MSTWAANEAMERSTKAAILSRVRGRVCTPGMEAASSVSRAPASAGSTGRTTYMGTPDIGIEGVAMGGRATSQITLAGHGPDWLASAGQESVGGGAHDAVRLENLL